MTTKELSAVELRFFEKIVRIIKSDTESIITYYKQLKEVNPKLAIMCLANSINATQRILTLQYELDELEENWNMGMVEKYDYEARKSYIQKMML